LRSIEHEAHEAKIRRKQHVRRLMAQVSGLLGRRS
jgi:hypothetical protein